MKPIKQYLTPHRLYFIFLHVAIIVLAVEVILLSTQNRELQKLIGTPAEPVKVGARFSLAGLRSANGSNPIDTTSSRPLKIGDQTAMFFENAFCGSEQSAIGRLGGC
jgi:hypothetical protein